MPCKCSYRIALQFKRLIFLARKDTVTVDAPHGSRVAVVGAEPLAVDGVPHVGNLAGGYRSI